MRPTGGFYQGLLFLDSSKDGGVGESMQRGSGSLGGRMESRGSREEGRAEGSTHFMAWGCQKGDIVRF